MNTLAVATIIGVAVLATGAFIVSEELSGGDCLGALMGGAPPSANTHRVRLTILSDQTEEPIRVCMFAQDGTKVFDERLEAHGPTPQYWDIHVAQPVSHWVVDRPWPEHVEIGAGYADARCDEGGQELYYQDSPGRGGGIMSDCAPSAYVPADREPAQQQLQYAAVMPADEASIGGGGAFVLTASVGTLLVLAIKFRTPLQWAFVGLFTRIVAPKVLDQSVRNQIHQLVTQEPGIRPTEIAQRLELAAGQTTHHLRVLVEAQSLSRMRQGVALHYFVRGAYPPMRMLQLAALRSTSVARLDSAVRRHPGAPLSALANLGGLSRPRASRLARRLQQLGLARAERHGKNLRLYPVH